MARTLWRTRLSARRAVVVAAAVASACAAFAVCSHATPITSVANIPHSAISPGGVDMATGEIIIVARPDLALDGPMPVVFQRYYASMLGREGLASGRMGPNWLGTYDWKLNLGGTTADVITNEGADIRFQQAPGGGPWSLVSPLDHAYALMNVGATLRFTDPVARRIYVFAGSPPALIQIVDERGNALNLLYTGPTLTQVSDGLGRSLTFNYDPFAGMLVSVSDGTRTVSYSYTGGTLTGFTDAAGQHWAYGYATSIPIQGLLIGVLEPAGNTPIQNGYDAIGRVVSQTDAAGGIANYAWDAPSGNLFTDPLGRPWTYLHDSQSRLVSFTDPNSQAWTRAYDANGRLTSETRPLGDVTSYSYDPASGYAASVGFADGSTIRWTYGSHLVGGSTLFDLSGTQYPDLSTESFARDGAGNPTTFTDRAGNLWHGTYNARGQLLTETNAAGGVTTLTYDTGARLANASDPAGNLTRYTYDAISRLIAVAPDDTSSRSYAYDPLDHLISSTDERGKTSSYAYDANGRLSAVTDPLLETTHFTYDPIDRVSQVADPLGHVVSATGYDASGRVSSITDGTSRVTHFAYDVWGDLNGVTDPTGATWVYGYDSNRRVTSAQDPLAHSATFAYDAVDRLTHVTDPIGTGFDYGYDVMDRLHSASGPLGLSLTFTYDARGLVTSQLDATSETGLSRDPLGDVSQFTDPSRNAWPYGYDPGGRLTGAVDPLGRASSLSYDQRDRPRHETTSVGTVDFGYDAADRELSELYSDATSLSYAYDDVNRVISGNGAAFSYDAAGHMASSNGLNFAYDAAGRIGSESYGPAQIVNYSYDARGNLSQVSDWVGGVTAFSYDISGNLTGITRPNGTQGAYSYDAAGVLTSAGERGPGPVGTQISSLTITRDALEQPTAVQRTAPLLPTVQSPGTTNLSYDAASQVSGLSWDGIGRLLGDGSRTLVWDGASRLESYSMPGEAQNFTYDGFGNLLSRTQGAASEQYQWNYANATPTLDVVMSAGAPVRYFIHTPSGLLLESIEAAGGARHYYHYDEDGNTIFLTDDTGAVTAQYAYGPYGDAHSSGATANNLFTLEGAGGTIQLGSSALFALGGSGGIYDTKYARMVSGNAIESGWKAPGPPGFGLRNPGPPGFGLRNPGPNGFGLRQPGPIGFGLRQPGPGGFGLRNPGPIGFGLKAPGPSGFGLRQPGPNGFGLRNPGPTGFGLKQPGPNGFGLGNPGPIQFMSDVVIRANAGTFLHEIGHSIGLSHGQGGGEIFVDKYSRVKVQFFWDRQGKKDANSSWIREAIDGRPIRKNISVTLGPEKPTPMGSATGAAGAGKMAETLVEFMDGDPDRPIVVGWVGSISAIFPNAHMWLSNPWGEPGVGGGLQYQDSLNLLGSGAGSWNPVTPCMWCPR